jgi:cytochrome c55X
MRHHQCGRCESVNADSPPRETSPDWKPVLRLGMGMIVFLTGAVMALTTVMNLAMADTSNETSTNTPTPPSAERQRELTRFVRQECGFCHGLKLTGGLGAPLTAAALADKPREALEDTILYGRTGTAMPGWTPHLSESDARWIVAELLKGFPE